MGQAGWKTGLRGAQRLFHPGPFQEPGYRTGAPRFVRYPLRFTPDIEEQAAGLAEDWAASPDHTTITLTIRSQARFTCGTPVDAAAVKWNLDRYLDKSVTSPSGAALVGLVGNRVTVPLHMTYRGSLLTLPRCLPVDHIARRGGYKY